MKSKEARAPRAPAHPSVIIPQLQSSFFTFVPQAHCCGHGRGPRRKQPLRGVAKARQPVTAAESAPLISRILAFPITRIESLSLLVPAMPITAAQRAYFFQNRNRLENLLTALLNPLIEARADDPDAFLLDAMACV